MNYNVIVYLIVYRNKILKECIHMTSSLSSAQAKVKQFPAVDIAKFFCAILVVAIHVNPLSDVNPNLSYFLENYLARVAVPFFFVWGGVFVL